MVEEDFVADRTIARGIYNEHFEVLKKLKNGKKNITSNRNNFIQLLNNFINPRINNKVYNVKDKWRHKILGLNKSSLSHKNLSISRKCPISHKEGTCIRILGLEVEIQLNRLKFTMKDRNLKKLIIVKCNKLKKVSTNLSKITHSMMKQFHGTKHKIYRSLNNLKFSLP